MTRYVLCGCCGCSSVSAAAMTHICSDMEPCTDTLFCWRDMQPVLQSTTRMLTVPVCHRLGFKQARSPGSFRFVDLSPNSECDRGFSIIFCTTWISMHMLCMHQVNLMTRRRLNRMAALLQDPSWLPVNCVYVAAANGPGWSGTAGL